MAAEPTHRVVIRRPRRPQPPSSSGSWKIAYADFITAMMAFFLVMWLVSITPQVQRQDLADYFRTPLREAVTGGDNQSNSDSAIPGGGADVTHSHGEVRKTEPAPRQMQPASADRRDASGLESLRRRLEQTIETHPVLRQYRPQLLIDITSEGLRIQIVDNQNRPMFATGRAEVKPHMRDILRVIGPMFNDIPNRISLSGHTDALQYSRGERAYSNWELSADRANASRRELVAGGMAEEKIMRVMGLSSTMHLVKDDPYADTNRRISLIVLNRQTQQRIERENAAAADIQTESALEAIETLAPGAPEDVSDVDHASLSEVSDQPIDS